MSMWFGIGKVSCKKYILYSFLEDVAFWVASRSQDKLREKTRVIMSLDNYVLSTYYMWEM